jgi:hypothetical protein
VTKNHSKAVTVRQYYTSHASILAKPHRGGGGVGVHFDWNLDRSLNHVLVVRFSSTALGLPPPRISHVARVLAESTEKKTRFRDGHHGTHDSFEELVRVPFREGDTLCPLRKLQYSVF